MFLMVLILVDNNSTGRLCFIENMTVITWLFNSELGSDTSDLPVNATMSKAWKTQRKSLVEMSGEFGLLADKAAHQVLKHDLYWALV